MCEILRISLSLILLVTALAPQESAPGKTQTTKPPIYYVAVLGAGANWIVGAPLEKQPLGEQIVREAATKHGQHMNSLFKAGTLVMGGAFIGDSDVISFTTISGAMLVLDTETAEAARH